MESEEVIRDQINAMYTARLFLTEEEKEIVDSFCLKVDNLANSLARLADQERTVELGMKALDEIALIDPRGKEIFDKYRQIAFSAIDPGNIPHE